jgi:hypothetical protein
MTDMNNELSAAELAKLEEADMTAQYDEGGDSQEDEDLLDFSLDEVLEGVQPKAEYQEWVPGNHVLFLRIAGIDKAIQQRADGKILGVRMLYEVLATEDEETAHTIGGLYSEFFIFGGQVPEYEKYSAERQVADGKSAMVSRLLGFRPEAKSLEAATQELLVRYAPRADAKCARVKVSAKMDKKGEYCNLRSFRVLDAHVAIADVLGDKANEWTFYEPFEG